MQDTSIAPEHNKGLIIGLLGMLTAFGPLSIDMYLPGLPAIAANLHTSLDNVQLSLSAFFIGLAGGQLLYGPFTDRVGRKIPIYVGLTIYGIASLVCAFAPNIETLVVARFFQALGSCAGMVVTRAIIRDLYDPRETARVFSLLMLIIGVAPILAPVLGGQILVHLGWRFIFYILTGLSVLSMLGIYLLLTETHQKSQKEPQKIFSTYWKILRNRRFLQNTFSGGIVQSGMFAYITGSSFVFIELFGVDPEHFGYVFGTNAFGLILFSQVNGRLLKRYDSQAILKVVFPAVAFFGVLVILAGFFATELWQIWVPIFLFMSCLGMTFPNTSAEALAEEKEHAGSASALMGTFQFGLAATTSVVMSILHSQTALPMAGVMGCCAILACCIYYAGKTNFTRLKSA